MEKPNFRHHFISRLRRYFISGLLIWLPIWVTVILIKFLIDILNNILLSLPARFHPDNLIGFHIPGIGIIIIFCIIVLTGIFVANYLGKQMILAWDEFVAKIPLVRTIYSSVKQILETLFSANGNSFRKVFLIEFPRKGMWTLALQTGDVISKITDELGETDCISLFVPTTPNITSGFLIMSPRKDVIELNMSVDQALKFIISIGVMQTTPDKVDSSIFKKNKNENTKQPVV